MKIVYTAPVGFILQGEIGIPYGKPALGCTLDAWVVCSVGKSAGRSNGSSQYVKEIARQIEKYTKKKYTKIPPISVQYAENIPLFYEGMQAAEIVAATAVLHEYLAGRAGAVEDINNIAFRVHKKFKPTVSGLYTSLSSFGGLIYFRKEFEFLKGIYKLAYKIPPQIAQELLISFQSLEEKKQAEVQLSKLFKKSPRKAETVLAEEEKTTKRTLVAIIKEDKRMFFEQFGQHESGSYPLTQSYKGFHAQ